MHKGYSHNPFVRKKRLKKKEKLRNNNNKVIINYPGLELNHLRKKKVDNQQRK